MEIVKSKAVKLRSHLDKYLIADADRITVRQSRNSATRRAVWLVEASPAVSGAVRLRNRDTGLYLTASEATFLLGMTGRKVIQSDADGRGSVDWKPERDGFQMRLRTAAKGDGKFLRANGGTPPWRNSVTHDLPVSGPTSNWTLWDLEAVEEEEEEEEEWRGNGKLISPVTSFAASEASSLDDLVAAEPFPPSPSHTASAVKSGMDLFTKAKSVRLRSHHDKYLSAGGDEASVTQHRAASSRATRWAVELVPSCSVIRLKSSHGKYLSASPHPFLLGMTGCRALQTARLDSSVEWEPIAEGGARVRLRAVSTGTFLRANGGLPPWRNSVTHDVPHRAATLDWVMWDVDVVEAADCDGADRLNGPPVVAPTTPPPPPPWVQPCRVADSDSFSSETSFTSSSGRANGYSRQESSDSMVFRSPPGLGGNGRVIYYHIADEYGNVNDENDQCYFLSFNGNNVKELACKLEQYTGIQDIIVCTRSPLSGKLCPLRLQLPPNTLSMNVVVVNSLSVAGTNLETIDASW